MEKFIYQPGTKTIRTEKTNYWVATMDSFEGAIDHERNAKLLAAAPTLLAAAQLAMKALAKAVDSNVFDSCVCPKVGMIALEQLQQAINEATGGNK
jgi:hypothetical protein